MHFLRVSLFAIICLFAVPVPPAEAEERRVPTVLDVIALWLHANYQFDLPISHPEIVAISPGELVLRRYGTGAEVEPGDVVALFDREAGAILVSEEWTGRSPADLSVLVHEMVHHLQDEAGTVFACPAAREITAYHAQNQWLAMFDEDLESAFGIDPGLILVATACVH